jgi:hypothetical protein
MVAEPATARLGSNSVVRPTVSCGRIVLKARGRKVSQRDRNRGD